MDAGKIEMENLCDLNLKTCHSHSMVVDNTHTFQNWCSLSNINNIMVKKKKKKTKISSLYRDWDNCGSSKAKNTTLLINWRTEFDQLTGSGCSGRYSLSVIDLMPFGSGSTFSSIPSLGGKPTVRANRHWSITPQLMAYLTDCSKYPMSVIRCGWTVNILMRAAKMLQRKLEN